MANIMMNARDAVSAAMAEMPANPWETRMPV